MDKQTALTKLLDGMKLYSDKAVFSRVAPIVQETVLLAVVSGDADYIAGYADAMLNVVERLAPKAEADVLLPVLWTIKNIVRLPAVDAAELLATIERLAA